MRHITLYCPTCNAPFYVDVDPPDQSVGIMGATIVDVWTEPPMAPVCVHVQTWFDSIETDYVVSKQTKEFEDQLYDQLDWEAYDRYADEQEARYEQWKEREER